MNNNETILNPEQCAGIAPTPLNYSAVVIHQIVSDLEAITLSVERGEIMPTPESIATLIDFVGRLKIRATAAGFAFPEGGEAR
ncbi:hypothetical protein [Arthrobacter bambusae]|uniref:hypothetical protein n=1 Tax=Arthrobacter bambusae TaxID=1338426 RepID=UPI00277D6F02|nr:hypothetical protein [Arthrobacter bambusae]MDQ0030174.1 hypothetical protein [Arthrobacter bambusae]MDQ0097856.1 hypothetical protein [Arthrobacter bambusae]